MDLGLPNILGLPEMLAHVSSRLFPSILARARLEERSSARRFSLWLHVASWSLHPVVPVLVGLPKVLVHGVI